MEVKQNKKMSRESRMALDRGMMKYTAHVRAHPGSVTTQEMLDIFDLCGVNIDHLGSTFHLSSVEENLTRLDKVDRIMLMSRAIKEAGGHRKM